MLGSLSTRNFKLRVPLAFSRRNLSQTKHNTDHTSKHYLFHSSLRVITNNFKVNWLTIHKYMDKFIESRWQPNFSRLPWHYASLNDILSWWANVLLDGTRGLITGAAWQEGGGSWALVLASWPEWARTALDYVAKSDEPSCCVSGSEVLRPLDTLGWGDSVPPCPLRFFPSDWDTSLSMSLSTCNIRLSWQYFQWCMY